MLRVICKAEEGGELSHHVSPLSPVVGVGLQDVHLLKLLFNVSPGPTVVVLRSCYDEDHCAEPKLISDTYSLFDCCPSLALSLSLSLLPSDRVVDFRPTHPLGGLWFLTGLPWSFHVPICAL